MQKYSQFNELLLYLKDIINYERSKHTMHACHILIRVLYRKPESIIMVRKYNEFKIPLAKV